MSTFSDQAALALKLAEGQRRLRELDVLADRERIARDLHDHVIQRLFAIGLSVQGSLLRAKVPEVRERLTDTVDDLQSVVEEIRSTIFDLQGGSAGTHRLRRRLHRVVAEATANAGLRTTLHISGPTSVIEADLADHAEAVVREALSNVVRHAGASAVAVTVRIDDDLTIEVDDNGVGMPADVSRSGLDNLAARARESGGRMRIGPAPDGGTRMCWTAPLP
jgi:signal transduction histidine kinase